MRKILLCLFISTFCFLSSGQAQCVFGECPDGSFCFDDSECDGAAMPVDLLDFTSYQSKDGIALLWITAIELNNEGFQIEISIDGKNWKEIGFVQGNGTIEEESNYNFNVASKHLQLGRNYFRLQQRDFDGASEYSQTITAVWNKNDTQLVVFPNPAQDWIAAYLPKAFHNQQAVPYRIFDLTGREVTQGNFNTEYAGVIEVSLLQTGSYLLFVGSNEETVVSRFVKQ